MTDKLKPSAAPRKPQSEPEWKKDADATTDTPMPGADAPEPAPAPSPEPHDETVTVMARHRIEHDNVEYLPGDCLTLSPEQAAELRATGVVTDPTG